MGICANSQTYAIQNTIGLRLKHTRWKNLRQMDSCQLVILMTIFKVDSAYIVLLLVALIALTEGMRTHQNANYDKDAYLQEMEGVKLRVQTDWQNIRQRIDRLKQDIANAGVEDRIRLTQEALADERSILQRIEQYIGLPFPLKGCQCLNLSDSNRTSLLDKMSEIEQQLSALRKDVQNCPSCDRTLELGSEVHRQEQYLERMKKTVESVCGRFGPGAPTLNQTSSGMVDVSKSIYVTNTGAPNWIYGNTTEQQYNLERFALSSKNNITKCPLSRPFAKSATECVDCVGEAGLWDLGRLECTSCPFGFLYDAGRRSCVEKPTFPGPIGAVQYLTNLNAANILATSRPFRDYQEEEENRKRNSQQWKVCPDTTPFLGKSGACINCQESKPLFNMDTRQCTRCPEGTSYVASIKNCTLNLFMTNPNAPHILETDRMTLRDVREQAERRQNGSPSNSLQPCPLDSPFFDGQNCISCPAYSPLFNLESQRCETCPHGLNYNFKMKRCGQYQYLTSPAAPNLFLQGQKLSMYKEMHDDKIRKGQYLDCPSETPYFDGLQCIKCIGTRPIFDMMHKKCINCPAETYFDVNTNTCVSQDVTVPATIERALMNIK